jgi:hypothetical protein
VDVGIDIKPREGQAVVLQTILGVRRWDSLVLIRSIDRAGGFAGVYAADFIRSIHVSPWELKKRRVLIDGVAISFKAICRRCPPSQRETQLHYS